MALRALAINCTLKTSPTPSSCGLLLSQTTHELEKLGVTCEQIRAVDFNIKPGVTSDEGRAMSGRRSGKRSSTPTFC